MAEYEAVDLDPKHRDIVVGLLATHVPGYEVRAYGSRVKWKARQHSDLDLAVVGAGRVRRVALLELREALAESDLPFRVDVLDWDTIPEEFRQEINRRHVVLQSSAVPDRWRTITLGECAYLVRNSVDPTELADTPYIGLEHIGEASLQLTGIGRASEVTSTKSRFISGDVLFGKLRPYFRKVVQPRFEGICSTDIWVLRSPRGVSQDYLFYLMASPEVVEQAIASSKGTRMPRADWKFVADQQIALGSLEEQCRIASVLRALDDRIELNRRMCETLEEMAQALFKSWFVDFDPVRAKMEGRWREGESLPGLPAHLYDLFPDHLLDSELGPIPANWHVGPLSEVIEVNPSTKSAKSSRHRYVAMASIPTGGPFVRERVFRDKATGCRYRNGDALVARITPCLENGKTAFVDFLDDDEVGCGSTELLVLRARAPWPQESPYLLARQQNFRDYAVANMVGSSGRQRVSAEVISQFRTVLPPNRLMAAVAPTLTAMFRRGSESASQSVCLQILRDAMLPKLISGEVRLPDLAEPIGRWPAQRLDAWVPD